MVTSMDNLREVESPCDDVRKTIHPCPRHRPRDESCPDHRRNRACLQCAASASNVARQHRMSACHRLAADKDCELGGEIIDRDLPLTQHDALTVQPRSDRWQQAAGSRCHSMERGTACRTGDSFGWSTWP